MRPVLFRAPCVSWGLVLALTLITAGLADAVAQDNSKESDTAEATSDMPKHFQAFSELLTGATLVGHFTMPGIKTDQPLHEERYEIRSVKKSDRGDYWLFMARIKYGDHDVTVPMPLEVKWAGTTPVITLDSVTIPKLGTFDARVVIDGDQYAGTWRHDDVGGHLFGRIEKKEESPKKE